MEGGNRTLSKTVDERVVEMRFDNKDFEKNVQTTMSTLDKFKQKLNFNGASKGLENIEKSAGKVNMSGLGSAVETVQAKFSNLEVMSVTALANITNSAVNAGKRIVDALTLEPVMSGFQEYETQINAVQTILANTSSKGTTLEDVNKALDELNHYADMTIYNFTEMTKNIGTFTAAGVDLNTSVSAIKGIANLAAVSGSTSQQASTAMYQLSQALAAGTVKLQDWNSVVNAGMGGQVFQDALKETAKVHGVAIDKMIKDEGSFRETLKKGWLTSDILTETLSKFTGDLNEQQLKTMGYSEEQIKSIIKMGKTANDAATKVKTFSQLFDTLKEAAQSGWTQSWETIVGDFEEAKSFLTTLSDKFSAIINDSSNRRNDLLEGALGSKWDTFIEKINKAGITTKKFKSELNSTAKSQGVSIDSMVKKYGSLEKAFASGKLSSKLLVDTLKNIAGQSKETTKTTEDMSGKLKKFQKIVNSVWNGDYKNGEARIKAITKAGYDYKKVQDLVNKTVDGHKLTLKDLSVAQLKNVGYTKKEIESIKALAAEAEKTGTPLNELIQDLEKPNGRELLLDSLMNAIDGVIKALGTIKKAWQDVFPPMTSNQLYGAIEALNSFSKHLVMSDETADKLRRTLRGLFSILGIVSDVLGGGFKVAIKVISKLLGLVDLDILSVTATIGDAITKFRDITDVSKLFGNALKRLSPYLKQAMSQFKEWVGKIKNTDNIGEYVVKGLVNGLKTFGALAIATIMDIGKQLLDGICSVLGIHSPSVEFFKIGLYAMQGLIKGIQNGLSGVISAIQNVAKTILSFFQSIDFGKIFAAGLGVGMIYVAKKLTDVLAILVTPLEGISKILSGIGGMFDSIGNYFDAKALKVKSDAILNMAKAIGILAVAIVVLSKIDAGSLAKAVVAIGALAGILVALSAISTKLVKTESAIDAGKVFLAITGLAVGLLAISKAMQMLSTIDAKNLESTLKLLAGAVAGLAVLMVALSALTKDVSKYTGKIGTMFIKMGIALLLMVGVIKLLSMLDPEAVDNGMIAIAKFAGIFTVMMAISKIAGRSVSRAGSMFIKMSIALVLMVGVIKLISSLSEEEISKGISVISGIGTIFAALMYISKYAGQNAAKAGVMMLGMATAMLMVVGVIQIVSGMSDEGIKKGLGVITTLGLLFTALIVVSNLAGENAIKAGGMLVAAATALLMITGALFILSELDNDGLAKALGIVTILEVLFGGLIAVTHFAKDCKSTLVVIATSIALLIGAVIGLSFLSTEDLRNATLAITSIIGTFGLLVAATGMADNSKSMKLTLLELVGVVVVLAGIITALSALQPGSVIQTSSALSLLLISFSVSMAIMGGISKVAPMSVKAIAPMLLVVTGLAAILAGLSVLDAKGSVKHATAISMLLGVMTGVMVVLTAIKGNAIAGVGVLALLGLVVGEIGVVLGLMSAFNVEPSLETAKALSLLLVSMSGALVILAGVGMLGPSALVGIGSLVTLVTAMGVLITAIGALTTAFPKLETFLDNGIPILEKIGKAIGSFVGNIVGGFASGLSSNLPAIGTNMSNFMKNVQPFVDGIGSVDPNMEQNVKALTKAILSLTAANLVSSIASFISNGASFAELGTDLSDFADNADSFLSMTTNIDESSMKGVQTLANVIKTLTESSVIKGLTSWVTGSSSLSEFGSDLNDFAPDLQDFGKSMADVNISAIQKSSQAIKALVDISNSLSATGGLKGIVNGDKSLSNLGYQLVPFGGAMKQYADSVNGLNTESITSSAKAASAMVNVANAVSNTGGIMQVFEGDKSLKKLGEEMVPFGKAMMQYAASVEGLNSENITSSAKAAKAMVEVADGLNKTGGVAEKLSGKKDLGAFGKQLSSFGAAIKKYSDSITGVNSENISASAKAAEKIVDAVNATAGINTSGVSSFVAALSDLSTANITAFVNAFAGSSEKMKSAGVNLIEALKKGMESKRKSISSTATSIANSMSKTFTSKSSSFSKAGLTAANGMLKALKSKKGNFKEVGSNFASQLSKGFKSDKINSKCEKICKAAVKKLNGYKDDFYNAGKNLVLGFANGITDNTFMAEARAAAMAQASLAKAKKTLDEHSPSKEFYKIGKFAVLGFVNSFSDNMKLVNKSGSNLARQSMDGMGKAMNQIGDVIMNGIDPNPTIRPVVDLSNIQNGVGAINGMFNDTALGNLGGISASINRKIQNGSNANVIDAIKDLKRAVSNISGDNYSINGVTYDDGSNIADAIRTIAHAAKIERRS